MSERIVGKTGERIALRKRSNGSGRKVAELARSAARRLRRDRAGRVVGDVAIGSCQILAVFDPADSIPIHSAIAERSVLVAEEIRELPDIAQGVVTELPRRGC